MRVSTTLALAVVGRDQADGAIDAMIAAAQALERIGGAVALLGLAENAAANGDRRIGGKNEGLGVVRLGPHQELGGLRLVAGEPLHEVTRHLAARRGLVDGGGPECIGMMPTCSSRASLRGEAEASTSFGRWPLPFEARGLGVSLLLAGRALGRLRASAPEPI